MAALSPHRLAADMSDTSSTQIVVDDTRTAAYGVYYTQTKPLNLLTRAKK